MHRPPPTSPAAFSVLLTALSAWILVPAPAVSQQQTVDEPFVGITTDGEPIAGLFPIRATAVSTQPIVDAARCYLDTLAPEQRAEVTFPVDSDAWRHWANFPQLQRNGIPLREMSEEQREAALDLIRAGLSARGFELARDIMRISGYVADLVDNYDNYGEYLYFVTVLGEPSETEPWGWQLDGFHLVVNYFVLGDQVVMTPTFMGTEPASVDEGPYAGVEVFREEEDRGLAVIESLRPDQREMAVLEVEKTGNNILAQAFSDNVITDYVGIRADRLDAEQQAGLLELIRTYVGNMREGHAQVRMEEVEEHLDETYFAWIGGTEAEDPFYYRIQSPVILIEFDHTIPVVYPTGDPPRPWRDHIHTVVRTPNANDYGRDLLRQHYEAHADDPSHDHGDGGAGTHVHGPDHAPGHTHDHAHGHDH